MHRRCRQQDDEFHPQLSLGTDRAQLELAAAADHIIENRVQRQLVLSRPLRDDLPNLRAVVPEKSGRRRRPMIPRIVGEDAQKIAIVDGRMLDRVTKPRAE